MIDARSANINIRIPTRPFLEILHAGQAGHVRIHDAIIIHDLLDRRSSAEDRKGPSVRRPVRRAASRSTNRSKKERN